MLLLVQSPVPWLALVLTGVLLLVQALVLELALARVLPGLVLHWRCSPPVFLPCLHLIALAGASALPP